jgi:hypothetical protein
MRQVALLCMAGLIGLVVLYPQKLKSWAQSTQEAASSSLSI